MTLIVRLLAAMAAVCLVAAVPATAEFRRTRRSGPAGLFPPFVARRLPLSLGVAVPENSARRSPHRDGGPFCV